MRKFFSVLLCIILIISICVCSSVSGSALFVADDLIYAVGLSMAASVLLSIGIAAVSGSDSQYVQFAEACAQITWEQMVQDYTQAEILAMITIENGKAYFRCPEGLFNKLKNWASNYNWSSLKAQTSLTIDGTSFPSFSNNFQASKDKFAYGVMPSLLTLNQGGATAVYNPNVGQIFILNNDNTVFYYKSRLLDRTGCYGCLSPFDSDGYSYYGYCCNSSNPPQPQSNLSNVTQFYYNAAYQDYGNSHNLVTNNNNSNHYVGLPGSDVKHYITSRSGYIHLDGTPIFQGSQWVWSAKCILAGQLVVNVQNGIDYNNDGVLDFPVNTDGSASSIETPVVTEVLPPAVHNIGSDQTLLVPIPSTFEDPSLPGVPLPQRTVKNRVKRGQDLALVPDLPSLKDKTPQDLGVLVVNNTDIQDTTISPTLNTTVYGDDSTTFVIIPQTPINTPIPNDDNQPLVSSPYPDVINPGNETITVTANDDIFPTANNPPATTARPSVSVSNPDEVASSAAEDVVEGVSEIASEAVKDIAEPLTPSDIEKGANRMKLMPQLLHKFPFCIPFDFYNAINQFSAPSEVPQFDIPIRVQSLNFDYNVHVDLTNFETAAKISRWFFSVAWVITLIFLTRKVIWK